MIEEKTILDFKFTLHKVDKPSNKGNAMDEKSVLNVLWIIFHGLMGLMLAGLAPLGIKPIKP
jgi:hypothetical protein